MKKRKTFTEDSDEDLIKYTGDKLDGPPAKDSGKKIAYKKIGFLYHVCPHTDDKHHLCMYILCNVCLIRNQKKEATSKTDRTCVSLLTENKKKRKRQGSDL